MSLIWEALFGCSHTNTSRVFTLRNRNREKESYVVCFDCSEKLAYDWKNLGVSEREARRAENLEFQEGA